MSKTTISPKGEILPSKKLPETTLSSTMGNISLSKDLRGSRSVVVFYPKDQSSVCANQLSIFNEALRIFKNRYNTKIFGINTDDLDSHEKFSTSLNLGFPLLTDDDPKGKITNIFGVYDQENQMPQRAIFLFDENNNLFWYQVYPNHLNPGLDGVLNALDDLIEKEKSIEK